MKISIVMLAYNHERFIGQALESILKQKTTYEYEVIVGEDCSTDTTKEIIKSYENRFSGRLKPVYRHENMGMIRNLIDCYERCRGEYIAMLEGDDYWSDESKLERQISFLEEHNEYVACVHNWNVVDQNGNFTECGGKFTTFQDYTIANLERFEIPGQTATIVFRNIYTKLKEQYGNLLKRYAWIPMDRTGILLLLQYGKIARLPETMSCYRFYIEERGSNWSSKHERGNLLYFYFLTLGLESFARKVGMPINCISEKTSLFLKSYLHWRFYEKASGRKMRYFLQGAIMFVIQPHRVKMVRDAKALRQLQKQGE